MMRISGLLPIFTAVSIAACGTSYNRAISTTVLGHRIVEITSAGNEFTNISELRDYAKLAAARICVKAGFSHFKETDIEVSITSTMSGGLSRSSKVYFYEKSEQMPQTALECSVVHTALNSK